MSRHLQSLRIAGGVDHPVDPRTHVDKLHPMPADDDPDSSLCDCVSSTHGSGVVADEPVLLRFSDWASKASQKPVDECSANDHTQEDGAEDQPT